MCITMSHGIIPFFFLYAPAGGADKYKALTTETFVKRSYIKTISIQQLIYHKLIYKSSIIFVCRYKNFIAPRNKIQ